MHLKQRETLVGKSIMPLVLGTACYAASNEPDPKTGFHSIRHDKDERELELLQDAIRLGYKCIDTAEAYGDSEILVGKAVQQFHRDSLVIATKIGIRPSSRENIRRSIYQCVERLGTEPDIIFIHDRWDGKMEKDMDDCIAELDDAVDHGLTHSIGISNFRPMELERAIQKVRNKIAAYQAKINLVNTRPDAEELLAICRKNNIPFMSSATLDRGVVINESENEILRQISKKYAMTSAQIGIFAVLCQGAMPIVQSHNVVHMRENLKTLQFDMEKEDIVKLSRLLFNKKNMINVR